MGKNLLDRLAGAGPDSRTSTKFTTRVGLVMVIAIIVITVVALFLNHINQGNIVDVLWAYFIFTSSLFGIHTARVTAENVTKTRTAAKMQDPNNK